MQKRNPVLLLFIILVSGLSLWSCKREADPLSAGDRTLSAGTTLLADSTLSGVITTNLTLQNKRYHLSGFVFIDSGYTLTIAPGTIIVGDPPAANLLPGALFITRGAKINAVGTLQNPIIFTSAKTTPAPGDWAGLFILGYSQTSLSAPHIEGVGPTWSEYARFGPDLGQPANDNDASGILKYVRIEYAGIELLPGLAHAGLTLAGVGCGTTIDFVEVFKSNQDGFRFWGGISTAQHLLSIDNGADQFSFNFGNLSWIQFALGAADPSRITGGMADGVQIDAFNDNVAHTIPTITQMTLIGVSDSLKANQTNSNGHQYGSGINIGRNGWANFSNNIVMGYKYGMRIAPGTPTFSYCVAVASFKNIVHAYNKIFEGNSYCVDTPLLRSQDTTLMSRSTNPNTIAMLSNPFNRTSTSFYMPSPFAPARQGAFYGAYWGPLCTPLVFPHVVFRGAIISSSDWILLGQSFSSGYWYRFQ